MDSVFLLQPDQVLKTIGTELSGLSSKEARQRLERYGPNKQPNRKKTTVFQIVLGQLKSPFIYVLVVAMIISFALAEYTDAWFIAFTIAFNAALGSYQEWQAERNTRKLDTFMVPKATVLRDGEKLVCSAEELVPGDVVLLTSGDKVPADLRLIETQDLRIDESLLTGESDAVIKQVEAIQDEKAPLGDRVNVAFSASVVAAGRGKGVVFATGPETEMGKLSAELLKGDSTKTPLVQRMEAFSTKLSYIILSACFVVAALGYWQGMDLKEVFFVTVALAVSVIPEGLPISMTVALSVSQFRMLKRNVIVKQLTAVEGLGSCTAVASDKTGTLTVNMQTARAIALPDDQLVQLKGEGYVPTGEIEGHYRYETMQDFAYAFLLPNEGRLWQETNKEWKSEGDAMDIASLVMGKKLDFEQSALRHAVDITHTIPYESDLMYAACFYTDEEGHQRAAIKGALEALQNMVSEDKDYWLGKANELSDKGMRVLAGAKGSYTGQGDPHKTSSYEWHIVGLAGFIDPLRPETAEAVRESQQAGVKVMMVTGDHPRTATAIGKELGLALDDKDVVTGREMQEMDTQTLAENLKGKHIFARVSPLQKLDLVEALIENGHYVTVTGDGANDAPALKKANIGVAMGTGTDMAKDASDLIIRDDNFSSIIAGIREGRLAYSNIRKVVFFLISQSLGEIIAFLSAMAMGIPMPFVAVQILWLNMVTNGIQDKALSLEGGSDNLMRQAPRSPKEGIFNKHMYWQVGIAGATMGVVTLFLFNHLLQTGYAVADARNLTLLTMVGMQNAHLLNARSEYGSIFTTPLTRNWWVFPAMIFSQMVHIGAMHIPLTERILEIHPISLEEWGLAIGLSFSVIVTVEIYKAILHLRRKKKPRA